MNVKVIRAHLALLGAASMWGLMSPMGKAAMEAGITGIVVGYNAYDRWCGLFLDCVIVCSEGES